MKKRILLLLSMLILTSCQTAPSSKENIVTSFYPIQSLMESLTGETYPVVMEGDAHDFELSPKQRAQLADADYFIYHGKGLEYWFNESMLDDKGKAIELSDGLESSLNDPHTWLDPRNALYYVEQIDEKSEIALPYKENVVKELQEIIEKYDRLFDGYGGKKIMVDHLAYAHLAQRYGFKQMPIIEGVSEGEASFQELIDAIETIEKEKINVIFVDPQHPGDVVKRIQKETGVKVLPLYTMESSLDMTYLEALEANYESLKKGLLEND